MRWLLSLTCASLAALLTAQWWLWPVQPPMASPPTAHLNHADTGTNVVPRYRFPALDEYREVTERTLFTTNRRPPEAADNASAKTAQSLPLPQHLWLTAILMTEDGPTALILDSKNNEVLYVGQGADLSSWNVASILPDRLILTQGGSRQEMLLRRFDAEPPPPPSPPRARATAKQRDRQATPPATPGRRTPAPPAPKKKAGD